MKPRRAKKRGGPKPTVAEVNSALANYDAQAVERFAAGASAMLEAYDKEHVEPLRQRVGELEALLNAAPPADVSEP